MATHPVLATSPVTGYAHPAYAAALAEFGTPRHLGACDGWILERPVPQGGGLMDAMGCYPLFACDSWAGLASDLQGLAGEVVSLVLVADPFGEHTLGDLQRWFPDKVLHFKDHLVVDLGGYSPARIARNHRRNVQKALREVEVDTCERPVDLGEAWIALYENLVRRHGISGLPAFSPGSLRGQLAVPGLTAFCARHAGRIAGMVLFYERNGVAYYHLGAYSDEGYALGASFAVFARAMEFFADRGLAWVDLGAGAGLSGAGEDGLTRFKRGWATDIRPAYLCGRIFDRAGYAALSRATGTEASVYFPAYRSGEFG